MIWNAMGSAVQLLDLSVMKQMIVPKILHWYRTAAKHLQPSPSNSSKSTTTSPVSHESRSCTAVSQLGPISMSLGSFTLDESEQLEAWMVLQWAVSPGEDPLRGAPLSLPLRPKAPLWYSRSPMCTKALEREFRRVGTSRWGRQLELDWKWRAPFATLHREKTARGAARQIGT